MGAIGQAMAAFAQPLIDQTDGSPQQVQKAVTIATLCWNMAIVPDVEHDEFLNGMREAIRMSDDEFREFRQNVIDPMIRRHRQMFPHLCPRQHRQWLYNG